MKISCVPGEKGGEKSGCSHSLELCQIVGELTLAQLNATATNLSPILSPLPPIIRLLNSLLDQPRVMLDHLSLPP